MVNGKDKGPLLAVIFLFGCAGSAYQNAPVSLEEAIQHATTKADHHALAAYYYEEARLFQVDATWHERIAKVVWHDHLPQGKRRGSTTLQTVMLTESTRLLQADSGFCYVAMQRYDALARKFREAAEEHQALARIHRQLAEEAPQNEVWSKEIGGRWVQRSTAP